MNQVSVAARGMIALGIAFLVLSLLIRPAIRTPQSRWADTASIVVSVLMVVAGVVVAVRQARRDSDAGSPSPKGGRDLRQTDRPLS